MTTAVKDEDGRSLAVDEETGEVLGPIEERGPAPLAKYRPPPMAAMTAFLAEVVSPEALEAQTQLSEAYDRFCHALLSPNDVQVARGGDGKPKEFKKKSAWRKLGRAFQVSTTITRRSAHWEDDPLLPLGYRHFTAEYEVRASFPWGQFTEGAGACSTREGRFWMDGVPCPLCEGPTWDNREPPGGYPEKQAWKAKLAPFTCRDKACGGHVDDPDAESERRPNPTLWGKAEHDVRGTAETRATNRAISNLIAAGEVSAEEVNGGGGATGAVAADEPAEPGDKAAPEKVEPETAESPAASEAQIGLARKLLQSRWIAHGYARRLEAILGTDGPPPGFVDRAKLSEAIDLMQQKIKAGRAAEAADESPYPGRLMADFGGEPEEEDFDDDLPF